MTTFYVATLARYVLVDAETQSQARELGRMALQEMYAADPEWLGKAAPVHFLDIRPATADEIELCRWDQELKARANKMSGGSSD